MQKKCFLINFCLVYICTLFGSESGKKVKKVSAENSDVCLLSLLPPDILYEIIEWTSIYELADRAKNEEKEPPFFNGYNGVLFSKKTAERIGVIKLDGYMTACAINGGAAALVQKSIADIYDIKLQVSRRIREKKLLRAKDILEYSDVSLCSPEKSFPSEIARHWYRKSLAVYHIPAMYITKDGKTLYSIEGTNYSEYVDQEAERRGYIVPSGYKLIIRTYNPTCQPAWQVQYKDKDPISDVQSYTQVAGLEYFPAFKTVCILLANGSALMRRPENTSIEKVKTINEFFRDRGVCKELIKKKADVQTVRSIRNREKTCIVM